MGDRVDRYVVVALGEQTEEQNDYLVRHSTLGSMHVLELPRPDLAGVLLARGKVQASVRHPNIVSITDLLERVDGLDGEVSGLVKEHVDGPTLDAWIGDLHRPDDLRLLLDVFRRVVAAVGAAHRAGVVLGNLSAENILMATIEGHPVPKVTAIGCNPRDVELGVYQAPEQLDDPDALDLRSDLWALGALLFHLLTRRLPFDEDPFVPLEQLRPDVPQAIVKVFHGLLEFDPEDRTQSIEALVAELSPEPRTPTVPMRVLDMLPPDALNPTPPAPAPLTIQQAFWWGAAAGLLVFAVATGCLLFLQSRAVPQPEPVEVEQVLSSPVPEPAPVVDVAPAPVEEAPRDPTVVSGEDYAAWIEQNPAWSRDEARKSDRANNRYLRKWRPEPPPGPVVQIPWAAARDYCASRGGLLGLDEPPLTWEPGLEQEWRDRDGNPATRRFDGVTSDADPGDEAFASTGVRCRN